VVITGGIHGDEQTGSHTARLVIRMLKSARVRLTALRPVQPGEIPYQEAKD
jgi:succinylglutamate desuccinylase